MYGQVSREIFNVDIEIGGQRFNYLVEFPSEVPDPESCLDALAVVGMGIATVRIRHGNKLIFPTFDELVVFNELARQVIVATAEAEAAGGTDEEVSKAFWLPGPAQKILIDKKFGCKFD